MSKDEFYVSISPKQVVDIYSSSNDEIEHQEFHELNDGHQMAVMIFERYFFRTSNQATCTLIAQNVHGKTLVRLVSTGASQGMFLKFDWGASHSFVESIKRSLLSFIIG